MEIVEFEGHGEPCGRCKKPIYGTAVMAADILFHPEHFTCQVDGKPFEDLSYIPRDGSVYCERHYHELFSPRCGRTDCPRGGIIKDMAVSALGKEYHDGCFVCTTCGDAFKDGQFYPYHGKPYCDVHFAELTNTLCSTCSKPIQGEYVEIRGKKYHAVSSCRPPSRPPNGSNKSSSSAASPSARRRKRRTRRASSSRKPGTGIAAANTFF